MREREISRLAARGFSDLNISNRLQITEGTVGRHLYKIYRKLDIGSRLELANLLAVGAAEQMSPHLLEREGFSRPHDQRPSKSELALSLDDVRRVTP